MKILTAIIGALALVAGVAAQAHHSAAPYDNKKLIHVSGTVAAMRYTNPHIMIKLMTSKGMFAVEGSSVNQLARKGWTRTTINPGDKVTMDLWPLRDGGQGGFMISIRLPSGKILK